METLDKEMPAGVLIRAYRPGESGALAELFRRVVRSVDAEAYTAAQRAAWAAGADDEEKWARSFDGHRCLVAEAGGRIVGFGDMDGCGCLDRLFVDAACRRRGVATALCDHLERGCTGPFVAHVSIVARPFFEARGYVAEEKRQAERRGEHLTCFVMRKDR